MGYPIRRYQTAQPLLFPLMNSVDHRTPVTAAAPTVTLSKNGAAFAPPHGAVTEVGNGWYQVAPDYYDADTLGVLILHATAIGADPRDEDFDVVGVDQFLGFTHQQFDLTTSIPFLLIAAADGLTGLAGVVPTVVRSKNGGGFTAVSGTVVEIGLGWYAYRPALSDVDTLGPLILHVTHTNADPQDVNVDIISAFSQTVSQLLVEDIFDMMEVLDNEMDLSLNGRDEQGAVRALNMSLRQLDAMLATVPRLMATYVDLATTPNQNWSTRPLDLLRLDSLWRLSPDGELGYEVQDTQKFGGEAYTPYAAWITSFATPSTGAPCVFSLDSKQFRWAPKPDAAYTMRASGYFRTPRLTARTSGWYHTDETALAVATLAVRLMAKGVDDETLDLQQLAGQVFLPLIRGLRKAVRTGPQSRVYTQVHTT